MFKGGSDPVKQLAVMGLGRMGLGIAQRLASAGVAVSAYDEAEESRRRAQEAGLSVAGSMADAVAALTERPRAVLLVIPAGKAVDDALFGPGGLADMLAAGDIVIDSGNSFYRDSVARGERLAERGIHFVDCGASGGPAGARDGLCLMVGGPEDVYRQLEPVFRIMACPGGLMHVGPSGAGHFVKMVHNAVEYVMLQAIGEGFELLDAAPYDIDLAKVASLWTKGSVLRGWLMELTAAVLAREPRLESIGGEIGGGSTGSWAVEEAWRAGVPATSMALAVAMRHRSRQDDSFAGKVVAALRREFGGHAVAPAAVRLGAEQS